MSATVKWNGDGFLRDLRQAVVSGLTAVQVEFQKDIGQQLNKHASNRSKGGIASAAGGPPGKATGTLARSWQTPERRGTAVVDNSRLTDRLRPRISHGSNAKHARIHEFGGTIKGKPLLTVPIHPAAKAAAARGLSARQAFPDLDFIPRKGKSPLLVRSRGGKSEHKGWDIMYVLVPSVRIPARPYVRPALAITQKKAVAVFMPWVDRVLRKYR